MKGRRLCNIRNIETFPVTVVFGVTRFGKVFDGKFEQISFAPMDTLNAVELRCLFEIVDKNIGGQIVSIPLIKCA
jgi:hypothetical protein